MERVQKEQTSRDAASAGHVTQGKSAQLSAQTDMASRIHNSPLMATQRKQLQGMFGDMAQLQTEEEEPLQGRFATAQREVGEEEDEIQAKFIVQREEIPEEEGPLQGKLATAQLEGIEEEEPLQGKFDVAQREGLEDEEPLQGKFNSAPTAQREQHPASKPNNTGLPDHLKTGIESLSAMSMDSVKVHYNSSQPAQLNALAYAQGGDIHVAPGQEQHLPHEAWHVVQQAQGRVQPTMQMKDGVSVNDDPGLEHEADVMGGRAVQTKGLSSEPVKLVQAKLCQNHTFNNVECVGLTPLERTIQKADALTLSKPLAGNIKLPSVRLEHDHIFYDSPAIGGTDNIGFYPVDIGKAITGMDVNGYYKTDENVSNYNKVIDQTDDNSMKGIMFNARRQWGNTYNLLTHNCQGFAALANNLARTRFREQYQEL